MSDAVSLTMGNSVFPAGYRLPGHQDALGQFVLGQAFLGAQL